MITKQCEKVVAKIAAGDKNAICELYELMGRRMFATAKNVLKDYQLSEDAVSESLISIMKNAVNLKEQKAAAAWILTIVRNKALDMLRQRDRETVTESEDMYVLEGTNNLARKEDKMDLEKALDELSEEDRQIVIMKVAMGYSHKEISAILGIEAAACAKKLQRALEKLRRIMKAEA